MIYLIFFFLGIESEKTETKKLTIMEREKPSTFLRLSAQTPVRDIEHLGLWATHPDHFRQVCVEAMAATATNPAIAPLYACIMDVALRFGDTKVKEVLQTFVLKWLWHVRMEDVKGASLMEGVLVGWFELGYLPSSLLSYRVLGKDKDVDVAQQRHLCPMCPATFGSEDTCVSHVSAHYRARAQVKRLCGRRDGMVRGFHMQQWQQWAMGLDVDLKPIQQCPREEQDPKHCTVCGDALECEYDGSQWVWTDAVREVHGAVVHQSCSTCSTSTCHAAAAAVDAKAT